MPSHNADYAGTCPDCEGPCEMAELPVFMRPYRCRHVTDADRRIRDRVAHIGSSGATDG